MDNKRTKVVLVKFTQDEFDNIKEKSASYRSMSQYIRSAINEYSNSGVKEKLESIKQLSKYLEEYHSVLFHAAANFNQAVKRSNELMHAGLLTASYIKEQIMPIATETSKAIIDLRASINKYIQKVIKD